jgi:hypothetical protein
MSNRSAQMRQYLIKQGYTQSSTPSGQPDYADETIASTPVNHQGAVDFINSGPEKKSVKGFLSNIPKSGANLVKNVANAVIHPVQTVKALGKQALGGAEKLIPGRQGAETDFEGLTHYIKSRYGSLAALKETAYDDPVGLAADFATFLEGGGALIKAAGNATKVSKVGRAGSVVSDSAKLVNPLTAPTEVAKALIPKNVAKTEATRLYESAAKPSRTYTKAERTALVEEGLNESLLVSASGRTKAVNKLAEVNDQIDKVVNTAAKHGETVSLNEMLKPLEEIKRYYANSDTPSEFFKQIDDYELQVRQDWGGLTKDKTTGKLVGVQDAKIPIDKAQAIKRNIYKQLGDAAYGEMKSVLKENKKALARGAKEQIAALHPELKGLNAKDAALMDLTDVLENAVERIGNRELFGLREYAALAVSPKMLIVSILDNPAVKSRIAILLNKVAEGTAKPGVLRRAAAPTGALKRTQATDETQRNSP